MRAEFHPDIFSDSRPKWTMGSINSSEETEILLQFLPAYFLSNHTSFEYAGGLEINSSNLKLTSKGRSILVKRWSKNVNKTQLDRIIGMMKWLADSQLPVPRPKRFNNQSPILRINENYWSCYPFIEGDYFSGTSKEIDNVAIMTGELTKALSEIPQKLLPCEGPRHLTDEDDKILTTIASSRDRWVNFFGPECTELLEASWSPLVKDWQRLRKKNIKPGPAMTVHFDLHPHNLIYNNSEASAILDFEACKLMPIGYALAFAGLKQCRQAVVTAENSSFASKIGKNYMYTLSAHFGLVKPLCERFSDLALAEIIRRICAIFRLNIVNDDKAWNKVLPIQLAHLHEAKILFEN